MIKFTSFTISIKFQLQHFNLLYHVMILLTRLSSIQLSNQIKTFKSSKTKTKKKYKKKTMKLIFKADVEFKTAKY